MVDSTQTGRPYRGTSRSLGESGSSYTPEARRPRPVHGCRPIHLCNATTNSNGVVRCTLSLRDGDRKSIAVDVRGARKRLHEPAGVDLANTLTINPLLVWSQHLYGEEKAHSLGAQADEAAARDAPMGALAANGRRHVSRWVDQTGSSWS